MGEYFLVQCLDFIELRNHVVRRINLELLLSLCDKEGNFIARDKKQDWKKVLPSLTTSDMEYIADCKKFITSTNQERTPEELKTSSLACQRLMQRYFTFNMMIRDDMNELHNLNYMHNILDQLIKGNVNDYMFFPNTEQRDFHPMSFDKVFVKFANQHEDLNSEALKQFKGKKPLDIFRAYFPIADMDAFPVENYVKEAWIIASRLAVSLVVFLALQF